MDNIRILCYACQQNYIMAGYIVKRAPNQDVKDNCEICSRFGYECMVEDKT